MARQTYAPNPYTVAQMVTEQRDLSFLYEKGARWQEAEGLLQKGLRLNEARTVNQAMSLIREMQSAVEGSQPLDEAVARVMQIQKVKAWGYSEDEVRRVLPLVMPIADSTFSDDADNAVLSARVVATNANADQLLVGGAAFLDPIQGATADCYLISSMSALAWTHANLLDELLNSTGFEVRGAPSFAWQFHQDAGAARGRVSVNGTVPMRKGAPLYARSIEPTEFWPSLLEKAYVKMVRKLDGDPTPEDYQRISNGDVPQDACQQLVGGVAKPNMVKRCPDIFSPGHAAGHLGTASGVVKHPAMVSTMSSQIPDEEISKDTGLRFDHAYTVLGVIKGDNVIEHVVLRDPLGVPHKPRDGFAEGVWAPDGRPEVELNQSGVIAVSHALFLTHFKNIGWVELG